MAEQTRAEKKDETRDENTKQSSQKEKVQRIVRILSTDMDGNLNLKRGLTKIKGVGFMFSNAICLKTGIDPQKKVGLLGSEEIRKIEGLLKNPELPSWLYNVRKDPETGKDIHAVGTAIALRLRENINLMRKTRSYRGIRHELGLPVRGQRTRSSFRKNKTVGVSRKKAMEAKKGRK